MAFKLGIVILTYDLLEGLKVLLKNVEDYTTGDYQVYVIENGQKKETIEWLKTQNVKATFNEVNKGIPTSWNIGIKEALKDNCTHFALLSDDIELPAGWWDASRKEFENGSHLVSVEGGLEHIIFSGWFYIIDKEALDKVGYFDGEFFFAFDDLDYSQRFEQSGLKYSMADIKVLHHGTVTIGDFQKNRPKFWRDIYRKDKQRFRKKYPHLKFKM